jgi:hypothetical protein
MALSGEDWKAISDVLVDRVERVVDERIDRIEATLASNAIDQLSKLSDHEKRIAGLEAVKHKALIAWTFIVMAATFVAKAIWDGWLKPIIWPGK